MRFVTELSNVTFTAALLCAMSSCVLGIIIIIIIIIIIKIIIKIIKIVIIIIIIVLCFPAHDELGTGRTSLVSPEQPVGIINCFSFCSMHVDWLQ